MHIDPQRKVAIVTGAGRGIGLEIAFTLAREGLTAVIADINESSLDDVRRQFAEQG